MPDIPTLRATQPYWVYWSTWWGFEDAGHGNTDALYTKNYGDPSVITQDEVSIPTTAVLPFVNNFGEGTPPSVVSFKKSPDVLYTLQGRAIEYSGKGMVSPAGFYFRPRLSEGISLFKVLSKNRF
jgi:hypothetical protein